MRAIQAEGPYLIGGWSFGGLVALEMAQQIQRQGQAVARLILLDTFMPNDLEEQDDVKMFVRFAPTFNASVSEDELRQLAYEDQMSYFLEQVRQAQPSRAEIEPDQIRRTLNEARALVRIGREYVSQAYSGPAAFFRAEGWAANTPAVDPVLSWKRLVSKSLNVYDIPGRHDTFLQEPNIQVFAKQLQACLDSLSSGEQKPSLFANFLSRFRKQKGK
jgi:thioesterase domain-containing protein